MKIKELADLAVELLCEREPCEQWERRLLRRAIRARFRERARRWDPDALERLDPATACAALAAGMFPAAPKAPQPRPAQASPRGVYRPVLPTKWMFS